MKDFDSDPGDEQVDEQEMFTLFAERGWQPWDLTDKEMAERYTEFLASVQSTASLLPLS